MLRMNRLEGSLSLVDGIDLMELQKETSVSFVNTLKENGLIFITRQKEVYLTDKGRVARKMGYDNFLRLENTEQELLTQELKSLRAENRGLIMVFIGLLLSLVFIISFWAFHWEV